MYEHDHDWWPSNISWLLGGCSCHEKRMNITPATAMLGHWGGRGDDEPTPHKSQPKRTNSHRQVRLFPLKQTDSLSYHSPFDLDQEGHTLPRISQPETIDGPSVIC